MEKETPSSDADTRSLVRHATISVNASLQIRREPVLATLMLRCTARWLLLRLLFSFALVRWVGGCTSWRQQDPSSPPPASASHIVPDETLLAYQAALEHDDAKAAYALLSERARERVPWTTFSLEWARAAKERAAQLASLKQLLNPASRPPSAPTATTASSTLTATLRAKTLGSAQLLLVSAGPAGWRVLDRELGLLSAHTPEDTLQQLLDSLLSKNLPQLLQLLSEPTRALVEKELRERTDRLREALGRLHSQPLEITGDRVHFQYDPRFFVDLVRESGTWRVRDLN